MHVAIIMDGNGRWAERRGLERTAGHEAGAGTVRRIVEAAALSQVDILTLYAFSSDNWSRPSSEVARLMLLLRQYLENESVRCLQKGVRVIVIGRRDRLSRNILRAIDRTERITADGKSLTLQLAIDYSARDAIARAANGVRPGHPGSTTLSTLDPSHSGGSDLGNFADRLARAMHSPLRDSSVDLLIRTGGERRLSDFLLWECAYAELIFTDVCWPDFDEPAFHSALQEFHRRARRFGGLPAAPAAITSRGAL
jgi:undecaprenyl diphosphate synthase